MRILLIEDDSLIGDGIKVGLSKLGFTVDWFDDGTDGKEALLQTPYDAVVLDLGLPALTAFPSCAPGGMPDLIRRF